MKHRIATTTAVTFCACIFLSVLPVAKSQTEATGEEKVKKVAQILNLSPQQQSQLAPILQAEGPKVKAIIDDPNLSPDEKKKKLKAVHSQTDPLVKSILDPTQYKQWEQIRKDEVENMKGGG
jgi:F0F1-type ATP synthase delta subunit